MDRIPESHLAPIDPEIEYLSQTTLREEVGANLKDSEILSRFWKNTGSNAELLQSGDIESAEELEARQVYAEALAAEKELYQNSSSNQETRSRVDEAHLHVKFMRARRLRESAYRKIQQLTLSQLENIDANGTPQTSPETLTKLHSEALDENMSREQFMSTALEALYKEPDQEEKLAATSLISTLIRAEMARNNLEKFQDLKIEPILQGLREKRHISPLVFAIDEKEKGISHGILADHIRPYLLGIWIRRTLERNTSAPSDLVLIDNLDEAQTADNARRICSLFEASQNPEVFSKARKTVVTYLPAFNSLKAISDGQMLDGQAGKRYWGSSNQGSTVYTRDEYWKKSFTGLGFEYEADKPIKAAGWYQGISGEQKIQEEDEVYSDIKKRSREIALTRRETAINKTTADIEALRAKSNDLITRLSDLELGRISDEQAAAYRMELESLAGQPVTLDEKEVKPGFFSRLFQRHKMAIEQSRDSEPIQQKQSAEQRKEDLENILRLHTLYIEEQTAHSMQGKLDRLLKKIGEAEDIQALFLPGT